MSAVYKRDRPWTDRVRASLAALLELFEEEPRLAQLCVIDSMTVGRSAAARRQAILGAVARAIDEGRALCRGHEPPPVTAEAVLAGTLGAIHGRLLQSDPGPLTELLNPLMSFIVLPYGGVAAARRELSRPAPRRVRGARRLSRTGS